MNWQKYQCVPLGEAKSRSKQKTAKFLLSPSDCHPRGPVQHLLLGLDVF